MVRRPKDCEELQINALLLEDSCFENRWRLLAFGTAIVVVQEPAVVIPSVEQVLVVLARPIVVVARFKTRVCGSGFELWYSPKSQRHSHRQDFEQLSA